MGHGKGPRRASASRIWRGQLCFIICCASPSFSQLSPLALAPISAWSGIILFSRSSQVIPHHPRAIPAVPMPICTRNTTYPNQSPHAASPPLTRDYTTHSFGFGRCSSLLLGPPFWSPIFSVPCCSVALHEFYTRTTVIRPVCSFHVFCFHGVHSSCLASPEPSPKPHRLSFFSRTCATARHNPARHFHRVVPLELSAGGRYLA